MRPDEIVFHKRTVLASAPVFLGLNHIEVVDPGGTLYQAMMSLASGSSLSVPQNVPLSSPNDPSAASAIFCLQK